MSYVKDFWFQLTYGNSSSSLFLCLLAECCYVTRPAEITAFNLCYVINNVGLIYVRLVHSYVDRL